MKLAIAALVAANLFWAGNFVFSPAAVAEVSAFGLSFWRWLFGLPLIFALAAFIDRPRWGEVLRRWPTHLVQAFTGLVGFSVFTYLAVEQISPVNASLVQAINPAMILLLSSWMLRSRPLRQELIGMAISTVGVVIVLLGPGDIAVNPGSLGLGVLYMVLAVICWSIYTVRGRAVVDPPLTSSTMQVAFASLITLPLAAISGGLSLDISPTALASILYIAIFASVGALVAWNFGVARVGPNAAGVYLNLLPVFTALLAVLFGAPLTLAQIFGGILVLGGMVLVTRASRERM